MKKFFQLYITHSRYIFKFWTTQVSMGVFGLIIFLAAMVSGNTVMKVGGAIFSIGFFLFLLYDIFFQYGLKNSVKFAAGEKVDRWEGLKISLLSYAPTLLVFILSVVFVILKVEIGYAITNGILFFLLGSYNCVWDLISSGFSHYQLVFQGLCFLPAIIACTLGYQLGIREKPLRKIVGIPIPAPKMPKNKK